MHQFSPDLSVLWTESIFSTSRDNNNIHNVSDYPDQMLLTDSQAPEGSARFS